jgi:DNA-binding GntR family transcriptional regulator
MVSGCRRRAAEAMGGIMPKVVIGARPARGPGETIAGLLREQIQDGRLKVGDHLPTTTDLASVHAVSPATVHRAFTVLREEGLIDVARGHRATVISSWR